MANESWGQRLSEMRERGFVGRQDEVLAFQEFIHHEEKRLLCFYGASGIGKTTLLEHLCRHSGSHGFEYRLVRGDTLRGWRLPDDFSQEAAAPQILFIDDFDRLGGVEARLRDREFPHLSASARVVICSERPLSLDWLSDAGWRFLIRTVEMKPLALHESMALLMTFGLSASDATRLHEMHGGNPGRMVEAAYPFSAPDPARPTERSSVIQEVLVQPGAPLLRSFESTLQALEAAPSELERDEELEQIVALTSLQDHGALPARGRLHRERPRCGESSSLVNLVGRRLGIASSLLAEKWLEHDPEGAVVGRDDAGQIRGYAHFSDLRELPSALASADPAVSLALEWLDEIQLGEDAVSFCRFFCPDDGDFRVDSPAMVFLMKELQRGLLLTRASVAISVQPQWVLEELSTWGRHPVRGRFEFDGSTWAVCGYDLRDKSPYDVIRGRVDRRVGRLLLVPSRSDFDRAVRDVLRHFHRGDRLAVSPLVEWLEVSGSRLDRAAALRSRIESAMTRFGPHGGDARQARLITATFLREVAKQRAVAAEFSMGFSTYRHHLRSAIQRLTDLLWEEAFSYDL